MANSVDELWQDFFLPDPLLESEDVISDDPNQQIQPDPAPGSDPNLSSVKAHRGVEVGDASHAPAGQVPDPNPVPGSDPLLVTDPMEVAGGSKQTPVGKSSEAKRGKRSRKGKQVAAAQGDTPSWLPPGWTMISKTRTNGATAGLVDRYYIGPTKGQRFRSKAEVKRFLETGSKSKSIAGADTMPSDTTSKGKEKIRIKIKIKNTGIEKKEAPTSFDYANPPKEVTWSLVDGKRDLWKPSIGEEPVPEATVQEWKTTFEHAYQLD